MTPPTLVPLAGYREYPIDEMRRRAQDFRDEIARRRSVRHFSPRPVPLEIVTDCIHAASAAPSGANQQPWHFVVVSDRETRRRIREAAEREEQAFYGGRAPDDWLDALAPLGTDASKPFLELAPHLVVIFAETYGLRADGRKAKHYYVSESVGIATGFLIAALHHAGLATLTHTPSPMGFLADILERPANERAFLILVVGYPAHDAKVPAIERRPFADICSLR